MQRSLAALLKIGDGTGRISTQVVGATEGIVVRNLAHGVVRRRVIAARVHVKQSQPRVALAGQSRVSIKPRGFLLIHWKTTPTSYSAPRAASASILPAFEAGCSH